MRKTLALLAALLSTIGCGENDETDSSTTTTTADGGGGSGGGAPLDVGAILPCPPGELELDDGACQPPGVPLDGCATGFTHDGDGGCDPIRPAAPCGSGELALLGETTCHPVAPCGSGTWGDIPVGPGTQYVNQSYSGGGNNGSQSQPWTTVQQAINAAASGAVVAVAAGTYAEDLVLNQPVALWGTCPAAVTVGTSGGWTGIQVTENASGSEVHRVAVTGGSTGITVQSAAALLDEIYVHDTSYDGIVAERGSGGAANVTLRRSLVERAGVGAIGTRASTLVVEDSVIRDTQPTAGGTFGRGFSIEPAGNPIVGSVVTIRRSVISNNREIGIGVIGSDVVIEDSLIEDTQGQLADGSRGFGIGAWQDSSSGLRSNLTVTGSVIQRCRFWGIAANDSALTVERTVVRDILPEESSNEFGFGIQLYGAAIGATERPTGTIKSSLIDTVHQVGLPVVGADATIETTIIRNVAPRATDGELGRGLSIEVSYDNLQAATATVRGLRVDTTREVGLVVVGSVADLDSVHVLGIRSRESDGIYGAGIAYATELLATMLPASGTVRRVVVEDCRAAGFAVAGGDVVATDLVVRDTGPQASNNDFGDGLVLSSYLVLVSDIVPTSLQLHRSSISNNARAGVGTFGATVSLQDSLVECNAINLVGEANDGDTFTLDDLGGNQCGCGGVDPGCHVLSSGLLPPMPF
ncbi:MAG: hypothetical protein DRI90_25020 [Deltaproteobacteria bacterium]|nr:MAG: hypothetical protein DRI90_25020 [Deltaproteobacteria bacterium]